MISRRMRVTNTGANYELRLNVYTQNLSGAASKLTAMNHALAMTNYDLLFLQETWFSQTTDTSLLTANGVFDLYRCDRCTFKRPKKGRGGLATLHKRDLELKQIKLPKTSLEIQATSLGNNVFMNCYLPIYTTAQTNVRIDELIDCVKFVYTNFKACTLFLFGDFNMSGIRWIFDEDFIGGLRADTSGANAYEKKFVEELASMGLVQLNHLTNSRNVFLDLIFSNELAFSQVECVSLDEAIDAYTVHHVPFSMDIAINLKDTENIVNKSSTKLLLKKSSCDVVKWCTEPLYPAANCLPIFIQFVQDKCNHLMRIHRVYTVKRITSTHNAQSKHPWLRDSKYVALFIERRVLYRRFRVSGLPEHGHELKVASAKLRELYTKLKNEH